MVSESVWDKMFSWLSASCSFSRKLFTISRQGGRQFNSLMHMDLLLLPFLNAKNPFKTDIYECLCMTQVNDLQILKTAFIVNQSLEKEKCIKGMFYIMFV